MSDPNNNGSTFVNKNKPRSFVQNITTSLAPLSSYGCSEVLLINRTGQDVYIYDNDYADDSNRLLLSDAERLVLNGVTNSSSVSAKTANSNGDLYFRAQWYTNLNQQ